MSESTVRVLVASPACYRKFKEYYPADMPLERLFYEQHQHRYQMFCDFLGWRSAHILRDDQYGIECDKYDRENSIYSIAVDEDYNYLGSVRTYSTLLPYMLEEDDFNETCYPGFTLPKHPDIFEGSRIISANSKLYTGSKPIRDVRIGAELLLSQLEIGLALGVTDMIGTMPPDLLAKLYGRMGWDIEHVGPPSIIKDKDGHTLDQGVATQNYMYPINHDVEKKVRQITGIQRQVSDFGVTPVILPHIFEAMKKDAAHMHPHRFPSIGQTRFNQQNYALTP